MTGKYHVVAEVRVQRRHDELSLLYFRYHFFIADKPPRYVIKLSSVTVLPTLMYCYESP